RDELCHCSDLCGPRALLAGWLAFPMACVLRCWASPALWLKVFAQVLRSNGLSPVWILWMRWCCVRDEPRLKLFPQSPHWKGFSPLCTSWCRTRLPLRLKLFPHSRQQYASSLACTRWCLASWASCFSPRCTCWCSAKSAGRWKHLRHSRHRNGLSSAWTPWCRMRLELTPKHRPHWSHWYRFSPLCTRWWLYSVELRLKLFLQTGQV
uniref:Uncharacterized protein n=1 Tax=Crocodylus porosus TaxID=8502 RepID=A0A7M4FJY6_CROPO